MKVGVILDQIDLGSVNALANFTFLTKETNLKVSAKDPAAYLAAYAEKDPALLSSHWIPLDPELWRVDRYEDFLAARRKLLAAAANDFLDTLRRGDVPEEELDIRVVERDSVSAPGGIGGEEEEDLLIDVNRWVAERGLPEGEFLFELADPDTGEAYGVLDLAWPDGSQQGFSVRVALLLNEPEATEAAANRAAYRYFTDVESFKRYVDREVLAVEDAA